MFRGVNVDGHFGSPSGRERPNNTNRKEVGKRIENPLNLSGRSNGLQAHKMNRWTLRR